MKFPFWTHTIIASKIPTYALRSCCWHAPTAVVCCTRTTISRSTSPLKRMNSNCRACKCTPNPANLSTTTRTKYIRARAPLRIHWGRKDIFVQHLSKQLHSRNLNKAAAQKSLSMDLNSTQRYPLFFHARNFLRSLKQVPIITALHLMMTSATLCWRTERTATQRLDQPSNHHKKTKTKIKTIEVTRITLVQLISTQKR